MTRQLGRAGKRTQVYDPSARELRVIYSLPGGRQAQRLIASLQRLGRGGAVPSILDVDRSRDTWRVLTTWVEGQSLASYLAAARSGRKPWPSPYETTRLFRGFVHGLTQFHKFTGQIHGDISPANLVVQAQPLKLSLIDFGSAWPASNAGAAKEGEGATLGYAAPERFGNPRLICDQFAASAVLYEMLTGKLPYDGLGGRAGEDDLRASFAHKYQSPSSRAVESRPIPTTAWKAIDHLADTGLQLEALDRFKNGQLWCAAADDAWRAIETPAHGDVWARAGAAVAELIEKFARRLNS